MRALTLAVVLFGTLAHATDLTTAEGGGNQRIARRRVRTKGARMTTVRKPRLRTFLVLLSAVLAVPVIAHAKDLCVTLEDFLPATTIVLKGFSLPGNGKCKPVGGWIPSRTFKDLVTGTACRFSDGSQVWITLQSTPT